MVSGAVYRGTNVSQVSRRPHPIITALDYNKIKCNNIGKKGILYPSSGADSRII